MTMPQEPYDRVDSVADYVQQSRDFLAKGREYLVAGDLHQASEKGWGAAAWMAKAVADAQEWRYKTHEEFFTVMYQAERLSGDNRLGALRATANELHGFFYTRRMFLDRDVINQGLDRVDLLLDILQPLTELESA
jgi:hypothetical protein